MPSVNPDSHPGCHPGDKQVFILAPTGKDGVLIRDTLRKFHIQCDSCGDSESLMRGLESGAGAALVAEEALIGVDIQALVTWIENQPPWSDLPLLLLTASGEQSTEAGIRLLAVLGRRANVTILERPIRVSTLVSAVESALRARCRQHEIRDYLIDRERNERQMLQTQKLESLGVLAGGVAHDFNNLLTGILGNASLALENLGTGRPTEALLRNVVSAAERAADLTRQLLAYSGKGKFLVQPVNLSSAVRNITTLVQTSIPKGVQLLFDLSPRLPETHADPGQMQQIVMNLVINGAEAIEAGKKGAVRIKTSCETVEDPASLHVMGGDKIEPGVYVILEVEDTGTGMSQETISRIFDPFFTTKFLGRGLGLAAVLGIVRAHHGALEVQSHVGRGTRFRALFPTNKDPIFSHIPDVDGSTLPIPARGLG